MPLTHKAVLFFQYPDFMFVLAEQGLQFSICIHSGFQSEPVQSRPRARWCFSKKVCKFIQKLYIFTRILVMDVLLPVTTERSFTGIAPTVQISLRMSQNIQMMSVNELIHNSCFYREGSAQVICWYGGQRCERNGGRIYPHPWRHSQIILL